MSKLTTARGWNCFWLSYIYTDILILRLNVVPQAAERSSLKRHLKWL